MASKTSDRILGFDGLRAIAVLLVFLHHKTGLSRFDLGSYGVWMFFVLSGFLIVNILYRQRLKIEAGAVSIKTALFSFMSRRTRRIFPIYYLVLFATLPIFLHGHTDGGRPFSPWENGFNFLYLSNIWIGQIRHDLVGPFSHLWTLSIEEQFYLFSAVAILTIPSKWTPAFCGAVCAVGLVTKWVDQALGADALSLYTNSLINYAFIAYGGLCILVMKDPRPATGRSSLLGPALLAAYLIASVVLSGFGRSPADRTLSQYAPLLIGPLLINILKNQTQLLVRILEVSPLKYLGKISYGFYLYHNFITIDALEKIGRIVLHRHLILPPLVAATLLFMITVAVSAASWRLVEQPILRWKGFGGDRAERPFSLVG